MDNPSEKKIDEAWKEAIEKEKQKEKPEDKEGFLPETPDFIFFVSTLAMQASIALGDIPNPATNKQEVDLKQAKFFIDIISLIKEKTVNNLNLEEDNFLDKILYELRVRFVEKSNEATT
ncbi:MAG: DUF1844 domain-containing protein [Candidatus Omnitrophota bacterium]